MFGSVECAVVATLTVSNKKAFLSKFERLYDISLFLKYVSYSHFEMIAAEANENGSIILENKESVEDFSPTIATTLLMLRSKNRKRKRTSKCFFYILQSVVFY